jgi:hypothetical protein
MVVEQDHCTSEDADRRTGDVLARLRAKAAGPDRYEHGAKLLEALAASRGGKEIRLDRYLPEIDNAAAP